jgi:hypothetical protein
LMDQAIEILKIVAFLAYLPAGMAVVVLGGGLDDAESDGMGVFIAVPLWPLVLVVCAIGWLCSKIKRAY